MAKRIEDLPQPKPQLTLVPRFVPSACGCGEFDPTQYKHLYSHAKDAYYCDIVCMVQKEAEWHGELVKVDDAVMTVEAYQTLEEVESIG